MLRLGPVGGYPYDRWPRLTRIDARHASQLARMIAALDGKAALEDARTVLGADVSITPAGWSVAAASHCANDLGEQIALMASVGAERAVIALAPGIARVIADRAVGGTAVDVALGPTTLSRGEAGIVGYVLARAMHRAGSGASLIDVASARDAMSAWGDRRVLACSFGLAVGEHRGTGTLVAPLGALQEHVVARPIDPRLRVRASLVIGEARLPSSEIASLQPHDVLVPDSLSFDPRTATGTARLRIARSAHTYEIVLAPDAARVAHGSGLPSPHAARRWTQRKKVSMSEAPDSQDRLSDVEVELSIELARLEMPVAEVAALAPGVVVTTGRLTGERVAVRAGDHVIAWGELVDVEGEVGVRLTEVAARG